MGNNTAYAHHTRPRIFMRILRQQHSPNGREAGGGGAPVLVGLLALWQDTVSASRR